MVMGVFLISSLFAFSLLASCQSSSDTVSTNVFATCAGRKVTAATILDEIVTSSEIECARACMNNKYCGSAILILHEVCQLLYEDVDCKKLPLDSNYEVIQPIPTPGDNIGRQCQFGQSFNKTAQRCECMDGFTGDYCENPPRDCSDFSTNGNKDIYLIGTNQKLSVYCGSFYLHILSFRDTSSAFTDYMHSGWSAFKSGFNTYSSGRFWIGNDNVHKITNSGYNYKLETVAKMYNVSLYQYGRYMQFTMEDEAHNYTVHFTRTENLFGKKKSFFDNAQFQAPDYNYNQCTVTFGSAWWYPNNCTIPSLFTGNYPMDNQTEALKTLSIRLKRM